MKLNTIAKAINEYDMIVIMNTEKCWNLRGQHPRLMKVN
jgi:hypothetical protein